MAKRTGGTTAPRKPPRTSVSAAAPARPRRRQGVRTNQPARAGKGKGGKGGGGPEEVWDPGVPTPTVNPYLTADDLMAYAEARKQYEEGLSLLDRELSESSTNTNFEQAELKRNAVQGKVSSSDEFAGRGMFKSSVRDADLFDIDATAELKRQFLDTKLNTTKLNVEARKRSLQDWWSNPQTGFLHNLELKKVENAQLASEGLPPWAIEPGMKQVPQPQAKQQKGPQKQPNFKRNAPIPRPGYRPPPTKSGGTQAPAAAGPQGGPPGRPRNRVGGNKSVRGRLA